MNSNKYFIYQLVNPITNLPFYIGKGCGNRPQQHLSGRIRGENTHKDNTIDKIRVSGYEPLIVIIEENLTESFAYKKEKQMILKYGRKGFEDSGILTNKCLDSNPPNRRGSKLTEEQKINIKNTRTHTPWNKGLCKADDIRIELSAEKHSITIQGRIPWNKNLTKSTDIRIERMSQKITGIPKSNPVWNKGTKGLSKPNKTTWKKGRIPHNKINLSSLDLQNIRNDTRKQKIIAAEYGISQPVVSEIKRGIRT